MITVISGKKIARIPHSNGLCPLDLAMVIVSARNMIQKKTITSHHRNSKAASVSIELPHPSSGAGPRGHIMAGRRARDRDEAMYDSDIGRRTPVYLDELQDRRLAGPARGA